MGHRRRAPRVAETRKNKKNVLHRCIILQSHLGKCRGIGLVKGTEVEISPSPHPPLVNTSLSPPHELPVYSIMPENWLLDI